MKIVKLCNYNGEWEGLYIDGKLVIQNHSIHVEDLIDELVRLGVIEYEEVELETKDGYTDKLEDNFKN